MTRLYKVIRTIIVSVLAVVILVPAMLYLVLSLPSVQKHICHIGERELTQLLGANVSIGSVNISPFNKLAANDVTVEVAPGDTALRVKRLGAGIMLGKLIFDGRVVISFAELIGVDARLSRDSSSAPLNIQPIIDRLNPPKDDDNPTFYDLRINNIVIRQGAVSYDVINAERKPGRTLDFNHLRVYDIKADILLPRIKNDDYSVDLKRLALAERSGLRIESLKGKFLVSDLGIKVDDFALVMPSSELRLGELSVQYDGWQDLKSRLLGIPFNLSILEGSHISPKDFSPLVPALAPLDMPVSIYADIDGPVDSIVVNRFMLNAADNSLKANIVGGVAGLPRVDSLTIDFPVFDVTAYGSDVLDLASAFKPLSPKLAEIILNIGNFNMRGAFNGYPGYAAFDGTAATSLGTLDINADYEHLDEHGSPCVNAEVVTENFSLGELIGKRDIGTIGLNVKAHADFTKKGVSGTLDGVIGRFIYKGYTYDDVEMSLSLDDKLLGGTLISRDENIDMQIAGSMDFVKDNYSCDLHADINRLNPHALNLTPAYDGYNLSCVVTASLNGADVESMDGDINLRDFSFVNESDNGIRLSDFALEASGSTSPQFIDIKSDVIDGRIEGHYRFKDIVPVGRGIMRNVFPVFFAEETTKSTKRTKSRKSKKEEPASLDMRLNLELKENETTAEWLNFFRSPVRILHPVTVSGMIDSRDTTITLDIDAPYLMQKDKFIDNTALRVDVRGREHDADLYFTTLYPTKKGNASITLEGSAHEDRADVALNWSIDRSRLFKGAVELSSLFTRDEEGGLVTDIAINPSEMVFNDTIWSVHPSSINVHDKYVAVNGFDVSRDKQYIKIDGVASDNDDDEVCLQLLDVNLDYIFETLDIGNAMFGGIATGKFYASNLFSKEPHLRTPGLHVERISYNQAMLGNADIVSEWDNATRGVAIKAEIKQPNGRSSYIDGAIFPLNDSLDFHFSADKIDVRFMRPFMEAFTSDVSGYASGKARLYGTFKYIDMVGEVYAEDLKLKLDFVNTYYSCTDSIHLTPGRIDFHDVVLKDIFGNKAQLNGWVTHECFKKPRFEFRVTDARNFLCFDVTERISPDWFGRIFCNGGAFVKGIPGFIDINVNISTAPNSTFTFVLSDTEAAGEYTFLTFRDRAELDGDIKYAGEDPRIAAVKRLKDRLSKRNDEEEQATVYRMNLQVAANPDGEMILVMDPIGGDRMRARGNGNLRIEYESANDEMKMFGSYALTQGSYNFTLQDIIIKDFTIKPGSSIASHGDPLAATLDIQAVYSVNANLSDLDESFLQDKDLNRTNVPVHALLKVSGDMQQPDISFDLEFPTLTQDTYRKVRSIVSTEDMMNRQIIYLLALNRFYTPDYMGATTKGNELVSVASSTISSQLSSMLGQLSDNWSIAPNFRSDKGDFSDMEVDLALSSYLLNNRLLFNGNFGYRDKALNNNSFIGDFDIEYLLNKSGNIRLKAYNRYNDQNYYVKSALTTQGVGIMFKRDFDNIFSFLRRLKKKNNDKDDDKKESENEKNRKLLEREEVTDTLLMIVPRQ